MRLCPAPAVPRPPWRPMALAWVRAAFCLVVLLPALGLLGCSASTPEQGPAAPSQPLPPPKPRNAHEIARALSGGGVEALVWMQRLRGHPLGARLGTIAQLRELFEGTGIDPARDLDRAFAVAPTIRSEDASIVVAEHSLPADRVRSAMDALVARSVPPGSWRTDLGPPAARVTVRGRARIVALAEENLLVILSESHAQDASRFVGCGGLPEPSGPEAVLASAVQPARTLAGVMPVRVPDSLQLIRSMLTPAPDGGADVHIDAQSTSAAQASADAAVLTREVARATTVDLGVVRWNVFEPIDFRPEQEWVRADRHLTPSELDKITALALAFLPS